MIQTLHDTVLLSDLTVISISGPDAASFLQSQLTQDIQAVNAHQAQLTAYCSPRGRVLATMVVIAPETHDGPFLLLLQADTAEALMTRLRMFVLRAKVTIEPLDWQVTGGWHHDTPHGITAWQVLRSRSAIRITAPNASGTETSRYWMLVSEPTDAKPDDSGLQRWQADDIAAGLPWVGVASQEVYLAQTLNLDLLGAISFTKGCYPGQEVIARSHYRGVVKRRAARGLIPAIQKTTFPSDAEIVGMDIYNAHAPKSPSGRVINAVSTETGLHILMEIHLNDLTTADYRLGQADGLQIELQALPYDISGDNASGDQS